MFYSVSVDSAVVSNKVLGLKPWHHSFLPLGVNEDADVPGGVRLSALH